MDVDTAPVLPPSAAVDCMVQALGAVSASQAAISADHSEECVVHYAVTYAAGTLASASHAVTPVDPYEEGVVHYAE